MSKEKIRRRIAKLEGGLLSEAFRTLVVVTYVKPNGRFGGEPCDSYRAEAGGRVWRRGPDETLEDFQNRVTSNLELIEKGIRVAVFCPAEHGQNRAFERPGQVLRT